MKNITKLKTSGKTYKEDFLERYPKSQTKEDGTPIACRSKMYHKGIGRCVNGPGKCAFCWNEKMPD